MTEQVISTVPLNKLAPDPANVRRTKGEASPQFIASIRSKGQLVALLVRPNAQDGYYVTDGSQRLQALQALAKEGAISWDHLVKVEVREESDLEARDTSLTTAVIHQPLHPIDRFEAFAELHRAGLSVQEIATRYGAAEKEIEKALALGALAPEIRREWREGKLRAEDAAAFALEPDHKRQAELLKKLKKQHAVYAHHIRSEIIGNRGDGSRFVRFITPEAYEAAGGKIHRDLFGDSDLVSDMALAKRLVDEKLQAKRDELTADGWAWALTTDEAGDKLWSWREIPPQKGKKHSAEEKARLGVLIELRKDGTLDLTYGVQKPEAEKAQKAQGKASAGKAKSLQPVISNALMMRMSQWLTVAAKRAIATDPDLALAAIVAGFASGRVVKVQHTGFDPKRPNYNVARGNAKFETEFAELRKESRDGLLKILASIVGDALDMTVTHASRPPLKDKGAALLCDAIPAPPMNDMLRAQFDAKDYFGSVAKPLILEAVTEAINEDEARRIQNKPKAEIVKFAVANVPKTGWLPKELRTAHYDGPARAEKKPAKAEKAKKKAAPADAKPAKKAKA